MPHDFIESTNKAVITNVTTVYDASVKLNTAILEGQTGFDIVPYDIVQLHLFSKVKFIENQII